MRFPRLLVAPVVAAALALSACATAPAPIAAPAGSAQATVAPAVVAAGAKKAEHTFELHSKRDAKAPVHWLACRAIQYRVNTASMPKGLLPVVRHSLGIIAKQTGVRFTYAGTTKHTFSTETHDAVPTVYIGFTDRHRAYGQRFGWPGEIGAGGPSASWTTDGDGGHLFESITSGRVLMYSGFRGRTTGGGVSWQSLILHEVGHALNLAHRTGRDQVMHAELTPATPARFSPAEVAALHRVLQTKGCDYRAWGRL